MISDEYLLQLSERGLIPGPKETEEDFLKRVKTIETFLAHPPFSVEDPLDPSEWKKAHEITKKLFGFSCNWVIAFYSDRDLSLWHGAMTWVYGDSFKIPAIQLKSAFRKGSYLKVYRKEEVLAHEAVHAARMAFHEPKFEEVLAYCTSTNPLRKFLGPLFRHFWESYLFVFLFLIPLIAQAARMYFATNLYLELAFFVPWLALAFWGVRLWSTQRTFKKTLKRLQPLLRDPEKAFSVMLHLTDREIKEFSRSTSQQIQAYLDKEHSLRIRSLILTCFKT